MNLMESLSETDLETLTAIELEEVYRLLEMMENDPLEQITLYDWQQEFVAATLTHKQCLLMCGNRVGKTLTGCYIDAVHATGRYPDWWLGYRFDHPPNMWVLGYSSEKCRDLLQNLLFGTYSRGVCSGGLIAPEYIEEASSSGKLSGFANLYKIRWFNPEDPDGDYFSTLAFKSYGMRQWALMGDDVDHVHVDEEATDPTIWPQLIIRTASSDKDRDGNPRGGRIILSFTPENGMTDLVTQFIKPESRAETQYIQRAGWDQAYHMSEALKTEMKSTLRKWQIPMRTMGEPLMGSGLIYDMDPALYIIDRFEIPSTWWIIIGIDIGIGHPQAYVQLVHDREADILYVTQAWKGADMTPAEAYDEVPWAHPYPIAWPHDGLNREVGSGIAVRESYVDVGFWMLEERSTWIDGGNSKWAGIDQLYNLLKTGRLRIFSDLHPLLTEMREYHAKSTGDGTSKIHKLHDDLVDALRMAFMMLRYAVRKDHVPAPHYQSSPGKMDANHIRSDIARHLVKKPDPEEPRNYY